MWIGIFCTVKFSFGDSFRSWISLFYTNVESAVIINGWMSSFFKPSCGVRQGCPLSPLLYVLCIEVLACSITSSPAIEGVTLLRAVVDVNWKIAHGVLYNASRLVHCFGMANIDP